MARVRIKKVPKYQEGGAVDPSNAAMVNAILQKNKDKNFVQRILNPGLGGSIPDPNKFGTNMSHFMESGGIEDGKGVAYPRIISQGGSPHLFEDSGEAANYAFQNREEIVFPNEGSANWFSKNYKTPEFLRAYENGGNIPIARKGNLLQPLNPKDFIQSSVDNTGRAPQWYNNPVTGVAVPSSLTSVAAQDRNLAAQQKTSQNRAAARQMRVRNQITELEEGEAQERRRVDGIDRNRNWVDQLATGMLHPNSSIGNYLNYGYFPDENDPYTVSPSNMILGMANPMQFSEAVRHSAMNLPRDFGTMVNTGDVSSFALDAAMLLPIAKGAAPALRGMAGTASRAIGRGIEAADPLLQSGARRLEGTLGKVATQADLADFSQYARNKYFPKPLSTNTPQIQAQIDASRNAGGLFYKELMNKTYPTEQDISRFMKLAEPLSEEQFTGVFNRSRAEVLKSAEMRRAAVDRGLIKPGGSGTSAGYTSGSYSPTEPIVDRVGSTLGLTDRLLQARQSTALTAEGRIGASSLPEEIILPGTEVRPSIPEQISRIRRGPRVGHLTDEQLAARIRRYEAQQTGPTAAELDAQEAQRMWETHADNTFTGSPAELTGGSPMEEAAYEAYVRQHPLPREQGLPPAPPPDPNALFPESYAVDPHRAVSPEEIIAFNESQRLLRERLAVKPSLLRKYLNKVDPPILETPMPLQAHSLSGDMGMTSSRRESLRKFRGSYNTVKNSPSGTVFKPTGESMSEDSYPFTLGLVERGVNEGIADVGYHGMQTLNGLGFPAKAGIPTQNILNDINQTIQKINAVSKTKLPFAKEGQVPLYSIQRKKNGGNIRPHIMEYAHGGTIEEGAELELSPAEYKYLIQAGYELE